MVKNRGTSMSLLEQIEKIKSKSVERDALLDQLRLWAELEQQGIKSDDVKSFSFEPAFLTLKEKSARMRRAMYRQPDIWVTLKGEVLLYNAVRLKNDVVLKLDPALRKPNE